MASVAQAATTSATAASMNWRLYGRRKGSKPRRAARLPLRLSSALALAPLAARGGLAPLVLSVLAVLVELVVIVAMRRCAGASVSW